MPLIWILHKSTESEKLKLNLLVETFKTNDRDESSNIIIAFNTFNHV